jgi:hypothetical protein
MSNTQLKFSLKPLFQGTGILPVSVIIKPQRATNPDYIDFIVQYPKFSKIVRTNNNVGSFYAHYNDAENVQYLTNPRNILYSVNMDTGVFQALTEINTANGKKILLMNYKLV